MEQNKIYLGDNIEVLKTFEDESIDCCVTSPPYYGLRDYGTGKWVGGDPNCPHQTGTYSDKTAVGTHKKFMEMNAPQVGNSHMMKRVCTRCGAVREDLQVGLEETPEEYIERLVNIFREVKRVLKPAGTLWVNIGDTYNAVGRGRNADGTMSFSEKAQKQSTNVGSYDGEYNKKIVSTCKAKDLIGIPWMLAFALRADGWYLRQDIIWHKPNPMPESIKDRCTKSHEYIFLLAKSERYYFDYESIQEVATGYDGRADTMHKGSEKYDGVQLFASHEHERWQYKDNIPVRNKRDVWSVTPSAYKGAHFATFPEELIYPMIMAGCPEGGIVLDPFMGSGTVGMVAKKNHRNYVGCELNPKYIELAEKRINNTATRLF